MSLERLCKKLVDVSDKRYKISSIHSTTRINYSTDPTSSLKYGQAS